MENHNSPISIILTIFATALSWLTLLNAQYLMSFVLTCIGIVSVIFAMRFYDYAGNEKKEILKNNKYEK